MDFFTFCEDQSCTVCPLGDVFEPLWAVIQCKHSRHVGKQSLEGRGQTRHMRTTLFVCLFVWYWGEQEKKSILSFLPVQCKCCWLPCLCECAALWSAKPVDTPPYRPRP